MVPVGSSPVTPQEQRPATPADAVGPIPGAADAGQGLTNGWQLPVGLGLATLGALAGGTAIYRRKLLGS